MSVPDEEIDGLYGLPLDEFTRARDELARRIRQEGEGERAAEVKQLRKPTLPAWVINQLARRRELDMQRLLNAGEQLAGAQAEAIRAQSGDAFLEARRDQQRALEALAAGASEILAEAGRGTAALDRVFATLRAGSLTDDGRALLKSGRLTEELEPPGFEALAGLEIPAGPPPPRPRPAKAAARPAPQPEKPSREPASEVRRRVRDLRRELRPLETRVGELRARTKLKGKPTPEQLEELRSVKDELQRAEEELAAAERELEQLTAED